MREDCARSCPVVTIDRARYSPYGTRVTGFVPGVPGQTAYTPIYREYVKKNDLSFAKYFGYRMTGHTGHTGHDDTHKPRKIKDFGRARSRRDTGHNRARLRNAIQLREGEAA